MSSSTEPTFDTRNITPYPFRKHLKSAFYPWQGSRKRVRVFVPQYVPSIDIYCKLRPWATSISTFPSFALLEATLVVRHPFLWIRYNKNEASNLHHWTYRSHKSSLDIVSSRCVRVNSWWRLPKAFLAVSSCFRITIKCANSGREEERVWLLVMLISSPYRDLSGAAVISELSSGCEWDEESCRELPARSTCFSSSK